MIQKIFKNKYILLFSLVLVFISSFVNVVNAQSEVPLNVPPDVDVSQDLQSTDVQNAPPADSGYTPDDGPPITPENNPELFTHESEIEPGTFDTLQKDDKKINRSRIYSAAMLVFIIPLLVLFVVAIVKLFTKRRSRRRKSLRAFIKSDFKTKNLKHDIKNDIFSVATFVLIFFSARKAGNDFTQSTHFIFREYVNFYVAVYVFLTSALFLVILSNPEAQKNYQNLSTLRKILDIISILLLFPTLVLVNYLIIRLFN